MAAPKTNATLTVWERTYLIPDNEQPTEIRVTGSHRVKGNFITSGPVEVGSQWKRLAAKGRVLIEYPRPFSQTILSPQEEAVVDSATLEIRIGGKAGDSPHLQVLVGDILSLTPTKGKIVWARCIRMDHKALINVSVFPS
jgi:hypothetical protein